MANVASPRVAFEWAERLILEFTSFDCELRESLRHKLTMAIVVRPVNRAGTVFGEPFDAVTTDISQSGLGFLCSRTVNDKYVCVTFHDDEATRAILEVIRCRPVGRFFEIGGQFIRRIETVATDDRDL